MVKKCPKCDGLGYVCSVCKESDARCQCPYLKHNPGKKPGAVECECVVKAKEARHSRLRSGINSPEK